MEDIEAELPRGGLNPRDYRLTWRSYRFRQGRYVAQRDSTFDPWQINRDGRTNIERMLDGYAPLDREGNEVVLHHVMQRDSGPLIEMTEREHWRIPISPGASQINRSEHGSFRRDYWRDRARDYLNP
jgi:filamentous hemagglutinin